jgi:hypothetical protein
MYNVLRSAILLVKFAWLFGHRHRHCLGIRDSLIRLYIVVTDISYMLFELISPSYDVSP